MAGEGGSTYDERPYASLPFAQTHPDRLAALAVLFGVEPPPLERCRVLELGCASGGNLIPMALTLPEAQFVGIDLSPVQIGDGQAIVEALALSNIRLSAKSIIDFDPSAGPYDYIIAHGVYSWVPDDVQARMLAICARQLSPNGIAFVSFNTLPGWSVRGVIRDLMRYHASRFADPDARVAQARGIAEFLASSVAAANRGYEALIRSEVEALRRESPDYVLHEYLEETNEPLYFHQFVERAARHELQYLADADFGTMLAANFPQQVAQALVELAPGLVRQEQYMDFLRNRTFRQALLVHEGVQVKRKIGPRRLRTLKASGSFQLEAATFDLRSNDVATFRGARGNMLRTGKAITKAAALVLSERFPRAVPFEELTRRALALLTDWGVATDSARAEEASLAADMLRCFGTGTIQLHVRDSPCSAVAGERPNASPLARLQARRDSLVTNLWHEPVQLDADLARLIQILDGTRDRPEIERIAAEWMVADAASTATPRPAAYVKERVERALRQLAKSALLL